MGTSAVWGPQLYGGLSCMGTSAVWGPQLYGGLSCMGASAICGRSISLFILLLALPQLLSNHRGGRWQHPLDCSLGSSYSHLEGRNHWWLWHFLFINMAGDILISHPKAVQVILKHTEVWEPLHLQVHVKLTISQYWVVRISVIISYSKILVLLFKEQ